MWKSIIVVALGGAAGSVLRFLVGFVMKEWFGQQFPWGTLAVNVVGCLLIGLLYGLVARNAIHSALSLLLITGFCGGFTTFSSFAYENISLLKENGFLHLLLYTGFSVILGFLATAAGLYLVK